MSLAVQPSFLTTIKLSLICRNRNNQYNFQGWWAWCLARRGSARTNVALSLSLTEVCIRIPLLRSGQKTGLAVLVIHSHVIPVGPRHPCAVVGNADLLQHPLPASWGHGDQSCRSWESQTNTAAHGPHHGPSILFVQLFILIPPPMGCPPKYPNSQLSVRNEVSQAPVPQPSQALEGGGMCVEPRGSQDLHPAPTAACTHFCTVE